MRVSRKHLRYLLVLALPLLLAGCITISSDTYRRGLKYKPVTASSTVPAKARLEVNHTMSEEMIQMWKAWANTDETIANWQEAVRRTIEDDFIKSALFAETVADPNADADFLVKIDSMESRPGDFGVEASMYVIDPKTSNIIGSYRREMDFSGGPFNFNNRMKNAMRQTMSELREDFLADFQGHDVRSFLARRPVGTYSGDQAQAGTSARRGIGTSSGAAGGLYMLERELDFNVLDSVYFNPDTGQVTLIGHHDARFGEQKIPYLQHLASLLENPNPKFSLEWTPESERKVDAFLQRMDSQHEMQRVIESWGANQWFGSDGKVTPMGRIMLPYFGVRPTENGRGPGYLGAEVRLVKLQGYGQKLPISRIAPGSPAEKAGLRVGDEIHFIGNKQPIHPAEVAIFTRRMGAGADAKIRISRPGAGDMDVNVMLGTAAGDPWNELSRFDVLIEIFREADMIQVSGLLQDYKRLQDFANTPIVDTVLWDLITSTGNYNKVREMQGKLPKQEFTKRLFGYLLEGSDRIFKINNLKSSYDTALRQGYSAEDAFDIAYTRLHIYLRPTFEEALRKLLKNNDEVVMPLSIVKSSVIANPTVVPRYIGVEPGSQLARVMLEADYHGKQLLNDAQLKDRVPGFETLYSFCKDSTKAYAEPGCAPQARLWFSADSARVSYSADGNGMEIRDIKMRINVRALDAGGFSDSSGRGGQYEEALTSLYGNLSMEFPVLHELSETAKLAVAAKWMLSRKADFRMPAYGRSKWKGPDDLPGFVHLIWSPNDVKVVMMAQGGVSLEPPDELGGEPSGEPFASTDLVLAPEGGPGTLARTLGLPEGAVPRPSGWVMRDAIGGREKSAVSVRVDGTEASRETRTLLGEDLEEQALVLWKADDLEGAERALEDIIANEKDPAAKAASMLQLSQVLHEKGEDEAAIRKLQEANRLAPEDPVVQGMVKLMYAQALDEQGDRQGAIAALREYLQIHPENKGAARVLAEMEGRKGAPAGGRSVHMGKAYKGLASTAGEVQQEPGSEAKLPTAPDKGPASGDKACPSAGADVSQCVVSTGLNHKDGWTYINFTNNCDEPKFVNVCVQHGDGSFNRIGNYIRACDAAEINLGMNVLDQRLSWTQDGSDPCR